MEREEYSLYASKVERGGGEGETKGPQASDVTAIPATSITPVFMLSMLMPVMTDDGDFQYGVNARKVLTMTQTSA